MARVLILGGGFGGLAAATELRSTLPSGDEIVVVSASDRFFMGFAKLWDLAGVRPLDRGTRSLTALGDRAIRFVHAEVTAIDPGSVTVGTTSGDFSGDALLVALGTVPSPEHLELITGRGHNLYDAAALPAMHVALDSITSGRVLVAILGTPFKCPPAPYEAALVVDDRLRQRGVRGEVTVEVLTPQLMTLPAAGPDASRVLAGYLADQGIDLRHGHVVSGVEGEPPALRVGAGEELLDCSVLLGVPAEKAPTVVESSPLAGASGFIEPDRATLRTSYRGVYAAGDCTMVPTATAQVPKAGVLAATEGRVAARNIAADLYGGEGAVFDGRGMCFLEVPGRRVAMLEGSFFTEPKPDVQLTEPTEANFERKQAYERDLLAEWVD
ncbi:MAG: NAD(P)/FAD-dependent oxidoreductase [Actinomycetota bacterium]|nr:NAD(P)/FAD-dependent oxidoreductase [Actinomycetota bacterium]